MNTVRELVSEAFNVAGITGEGLNLDARQLSTGVTQLNLILDQVFGEGKGNVQIGESCTFTGVPDYTVGLQGSGQDIELQIIPVSIEKIIVYQGNARLICRPTTGEVYFSKSLDQIQNSVPSHFYYERTWPNPKIRFFEGTPGGRGEIIYTFNNVDVTANTLLAPFPRAIKPYLIYQLAAKLAGLYNFETASLYSEASLAWRSYSSSVYKGQTARHDASAPGQAAGGKYNIFKGPAV